MLVVARNNEIVVVGVVLVPVVELVLGVNYDYHLHWLYGARGGRGVVH